MALVRWEPGREVDSLQSEVNRVFDAFFGGSATPTRARRWVPPMDLVETEDHLVLRADLPGMKREDVEIEIKDGALTIAGERTAEHEQKTEGYYRVERASGRFARSLTLPEGTEPEGIDAQFENGVLEVRIPKPAQRKPHRIEIRAGEHANANGNGATHETIEA